MTTECNASYLDFPMLGSRQVLADFDGGDISSDGGALLLRETERLTGIIRQFAACFTDHRNPDLIEHTVEELIAQRVYALALGYEDLNDHDDLRRDPLARHRRRQGRPHGQDPPTAARPGQGAGRQEHAQPPRTDPRRRPTRTAATRRSPAAPTTSNASS